MTDHSKKLIDMLIANMLSGSANPQDLISDITGFLDELGEAGALPAEQLETFKAEFAEQRDTLGYDLEPQPEIFDALEDNDIPAIKTALKNWEVNARHGEFDKTALYAAVSNMFGTSLEVIDLLLDAGADPRKGLTHTGVLHGLGFGHHDEIAPEDLAARIRRCVSLGAILEERSENLEWTPLHTALNEWNEVASKALLLAGADPNTRAGVNNRACTSGQSCLEMVVAEPVLFEMLLDHGADPSATNPQGTTVRDGIKTWLNDCDDAEIRADLESCLAALDAREQPS